MHPIPSQPETDSPPRRRSLALTIVETLAQRIREGALAVGSRLPTEAAVMKSFGVSRTVVREALSRLQAAGLVETRHGIGTFVLGRGEPPGFRIAHDPAATVRDVVAVLELRMGFEAEAAALAALRRTDAQLAAMREALAGFARAVDEQGDAVAPDLQLHSEIARATHNAHFIDFTGYLGALLIPRTRLNTAHLAGQPRPDYLQRVHTEHETIVDAIAHQDPEAARAAMRTHLSNSRERLRRAQAASAS